MNSNGADEEVGVVLIDHLVFESVPELGFPMIRAVNLMPFAVSLCHLPVGAGHAVSVAFGVIANEGVKELPWDFL